MIRLGCRDNSFFRLSHASALSVIADLGLDGVDVTVSDRHPQLAPAEVVAEPVVVGRRVRQVADDLGLAVADAFFLTGAPGGVVRRVDDPDAAGRAAARDQFERLVAFASELGAPGITVLPGTPWDDRAEGLRVAAEELQWRATVAAEAGMRLSFEPHGIANVRTPVEVAELIAAAPDVRVTLDLSHMCAAGIPDSDCDVLLPIAGHVQFRQARRGDMQARAADGEIDLPRLVRKLVESGYDGWVSAEYVIADHATEVDTITQTAIFRDQARSVLAALVTEVPT
jgi:sugar phosphate isomerase/epimerase